MSCKCPHNEMTHILIRKRILQKVYNITDEEVYNIEIRIKELEREFEMKKHNMNEDIQKYDIFILTRFGKLRKINWIRSTDDYNHYFFNLHHFIEKQHYEENKSWYEERNIKQFLVLLPTVIHEQLHGTAIKNLSDEEFKARYKISKWALLFNRKHTEY